MTSAAAIPKGRRGRRIDAADKSLCEIDGFVE
jgi:hypothetical protein